MIKVVDAIGDILYVVFGLCVCLGVDIEPVFEEIHRSNMSKEAPLEILGKPRKGKDYFEPDIKTEIEKQLI